MNSPQEITGFVSIFLRSFGWAGDYGLFVVIGGHAPLLHRGFAAANPWCIATSRSPKRDMKASEFLRKARGKRSMTDLAKEVKCSPAYIGDVERGNRALTLANSNKWAKALNISHPELVQLLLQDMLDK